MPYPKRKTYSRKRKYTPRRYGKRKRFSKKKFVKSTLQYSKINTSVMPRSMYVKLPFAVDFDQQVSVGGSFTWVFLGNSIGPYKQDLVNPPYTPGDIFCQAATQWGAFFDQYVALASSIKLQVLSGGTSGVFRIVLLAVPVNDTDVATQAGILNAFTYDDLVSWPGASWRTLGVSTGGNMVGTWMKNFTKTKSILGVKDVRDNGQLFSEMPDPDGTQATARTAANEQWFFYLRAFNLGTNLQNVRIILRMKQYLFMKQRNFYGQTTVPAE